MIRVDAVWLATEPLDMRSGIDSALARVVQVFGGGLEHVIGHHQNVTAATGRVQHGDGFGVKRVAIFTHAGLDEGIKLCLHLGRLLGGG